MARVLLVLGILLAIGAALAATVGALAYGTAPDRDGEATFAGLGAPVWIGWAADGHPVIEAESEGDAFAGLGYAHGIDRAWSMALWRQVALGELSAWFGAASLGPDVAAAHLGFADAAQAAYAATDARTRAALDAYARGISRAFAEATVAERDEFVLFDVRPTPWEPWHSLAVERLMAWLGTEPPELPADSSGVPGLPSFAEADSTLRATLGLGGMWASRAFATGAGSPGQPRALVAHVPYGTSALGLVEGAVLRVDGRGVALAGIPGTLTFPAGLDDRGRGWAVFPTSTVRPDTASRRRPPPTFARLRDRQGNEAAVEVLRDEAALWVGPRRLQWRGLGGTTDADAFVRLAGGEPSGPFEVLDGSGFSSWSSSSASSAARYTLDASRGTLVSDDSLARRAAPRLAALLGAGASPAALASDVGSPWALAQLGPMLRALGPRDSLARDLREPYAFLRGWDGLYDTGGVAPTLLDAWLDAHRRILGRDFDPASRVDSALVAHTLRAGVSALRDSLGGDLGTWAWGRLGGTLAYPIWASRRRVPRAYREHEVEARGHPTALHPGASLAMAAPRGPAVATIWTDGAALHVRRPRSDRGVPIDGASPLATRTLRPSEPAPARVLRFLPRP